MAISSVLIRFKSLDSASPLVIDTVLDRYES
jgi:hypothetical protein